MSAASPPVHVSLGASISQVVIAPEPGRYLCSGAPLGEIYYWYNGLVSYGVLSSQSTVDQATGKLKVSFDKFGGGVGTFTRAGTASRSDLVFAKAGACWN